ncbi:MAG TPA: cytochrome c oxidase assembly protein [Gaiellales bacterium]|nr:cytochrome c oxidase assembly protein [Gaiellales bacterium]
MTTPLLVSDNVQLLPIAALVVGYTALAAKRSKRGRPFNPRQWCFFAAALALLLLALMPPLEPLTDQLFAAHMTQHLLLGDLAPLCLALSMDGALVRPLLARRPLRRLRWLTHPAVALPVWTISLLVWHLPRLYDAALSSPVVHLFEHACFFTAGLLMWMSILETLPGPAWFSIGWKAASVFVVRAVGMSLGNLFFWSSAPIYPAYVHADRPFGLTPQADQQIAGGVMMAEGSMVTAVVLIWLMLKYLSQAEAGQRLLEAGKSPPAVARAVRFGRAQSASTTRQSRPGTAHGRGPS